MKSMKKMKRRIITIIAFLCTLQGMAQQTPQYTVADSLRVTELLAAAVKEDATTNWMVFFARKLKGIPYVAKTLEGNKRERLIVNLRQLDCTTYVETVLALSRCAKNRETTLADYCRNLQQIRYLHGKIGYTTRLHYFTDWIIDNTAKQYVKELTEPTKVFSTPKTLNINFMSTHIQLYPMLVNNPDWVKTIAEQEKKLTGKVIHYLPKGKITDTPLLRQTIHDGDIICICTNKSGLDISHIGFAVWHKDGLHMLHASQLKKKVIEDPLTLYQYMQQHSSQTGIRVVRPLMASQ